MPEFQSLCPGLWFEGDVMHIDGAKLAAYFGWPPTEASERRAMQMALDCALSQGLILASTPRQHVYPERN